MPEFNLVKIDGKPLEKLIDSVSKGIGTLYRPRSIRKEAEAKAYEIEILERAKSKALAEGKEIEADSFNRIQDRLINKEIKRQHNIDRVAEIAAEELQDEQEISEEPVDEDWSTRFFNIAHDISDEEMQHLWGRILAGEVKKPKSYSLRTLEFLKNLSKDEALTFMKFAKLALFSAGKNFVFKPGGDYLEKHFNITFADILLLQELGLLNTGDHLSLNLKAPEKEGNNYLLYNHKAIVISYKEGAPTKSLPALVFTSIAMELLQLVPKSIELDYVKKIREYLKHEKIVVKIGNLAIDQNKQKIIVNIVDIPE